MVIIKSLLLIFSIIYDLYLFSYSKWEKTTNQNKIGSFFIKLFILLNIGVLITSFSNRFYYSS